MTEAIAQIVIIRGSPGAGKSQAAKMLTSFFPDGAKIEVDLLRKMVISVDWKNQQEHITLLQIAARLAHDFISQGFKPVIVVDTFSGDKVNGFLDFLRRLDRSLTVKIVGLHLSDEVLRKRLERRPSDEFRDFGISQKLNADTIKLKHDSESQIDTSDLSPQQVAERIYRCLT